MESKDTKKSDQNITRHLVTYSIVKNKYGGSERTTKVVEGDLVKWFNELRSDPSYEKCIIEFAIYLW